MFERLLWINIFNVSSWLLSFSSVKENIFFNIIKNYCDERIFAGQINVQCAGTMANPLYTLKRYLLNLYWIIIYKKRLQHRCFSVKFAKFLRTPFFKEHLRWLFELSAGTSSRLHSFFNYCKNENPIQRRFVVKVLLLDTSVNALWRSSYTTMKPYFLLII